MSGSTSFLALGGRKKKKSFATRATYQQKETAEQRAVLPDLYYHNIPK
jgi:hypothetical protein